MEITSFLNLFASQFDETDSAIFKPETRFKELDEWSSLISLSIIAMIDEEYDITIKGDDIRNNETIEKLFKIVQSKKQL